jgi:nicotinate-nucleotide adenylyltransferase
MQEGYYKIGIAGGTFDPVHNGHLVIAAAIKEKYYLDKVIFIPTGNPPHKKGMNVTDAEHRYNMLCSAVSSKTDFEVSRIEIDRIGLTFTVDTLTELKKMYGNGSEFFFITGADVVHDLLSWRDFEKVFTMCEFITTLRPGFEKSSLLEVINSLKLKYNLKISFFEIPLIDISSTMIREKVNKNHSINKLVPESVEKYIADNNLYKL